MGEQDQLHLKGTVKMAYIWWLWCTCIESAKAVRPNSLERFIFGSILFRRTARVAPGGAARFGDLYYYCEDPEEIYTVCLGA